MILVYLILAHLAGDFIFQPKSLVKWKMRSKKGLLVHVFIHFVIILLVLIPYLLKGFLWPLAVAFAISTTHFFIDLAKITYIKRHTSGPKPFFLDQAAHLAVIFLIFILITAIAP
ncbi:MAG: DUF3307 domain-containing protein [Candidatus Peregrinibacteria bacterium]